MKTYQVLGRDIHVDPTAKYIKPSGVTTNALINGSARFEPIDVESFLAAVRGYLLKITIRFMKV